MPKTFKELMNFIQQKEIEAESDISKNEDFLLEDCPIMKDGLRWFVQEWLPEHVPSDN